jgi:hypothetical protein
MIRTILGLVQVVPLAITLFVAIAGAFVALIGGLAGWADVTEFGKLAAGLGALGFFGWFLFPVILRSL